MPFDACSAHVAGQLSGQSRKVNTVAQLSKMQEVVYAETVKEGVKASDRAMLLRGYVEAEKLKRIIKGQPANTSQSIRSEAKPKKSRSSVGPLEPVQVEPVLQSKPKADTNGDALEWSTRSHNSRHAKAK